ncbi:hypothetical protein [Neisseria meningitidis]|uniref:hypothetical protein n=1 Tax=Neisseria meningitidis TaxID=487 RepID=UPI001E423257|nr:hypothetical protein [Neisseria meningitidis]
MFAASGKNFYSGLTKIRTRRRAADGINSTARQGEAKTDSLGASAPLEESFSWLSQERAAGFCLNHYIKSFLKYADIRISNLPYDYGFLSYLP